MSQFNSGWYLIYTRPFLEKNVSDFLKKNEINCYSPTYKKIQISSSRRRTVEVPYFPSYVFVQLFSVKEYLKSLEAHGMMSYVKCGRDMVKVRDSVLEQLRKGFDNGFPAEITADNFETGQVVYINNGAFNGLPVEIIKHRGKDKILIRLNILNRSILLDMPTTYLKSA